jgi:hypothetical protein
LVELWHRHGSKERDIKNSLIARNLWVGKQSLKTLAKALRAYLSLSLSIVSLGCLLELAAAASGGQRLPLFPELQLDNQAPQGGWPAVQGRVSLGSVWFENPGIPCASGFDTLAMAWLTTRLVFICPYSFGRTTLGIEASPEIQWPTGESLSLSPRPGIRLAHLQNTVLTDSITHFFRLSYKFAWQDRSASGAPTIGAKAVSIALIQDWSDFFDSAYSTGVFYRLHSDQPSNGDVVGEGADSERLLLFDFEQSLPLALREFGIVSGTALAKWSRVGVSFRARSGQFHWGGGLHYGSLAYEWLQIAMVYPTLHFAFDFGG